MADYFQTIIDIQVDAGGADHLARHIVSYLAGKGVIAPNPSEEGGYPRGPGALDISDRAERRPAHETIPPVYSHLQVMIGRAAHSGDLGEVRPPKADCPSCGRTLEDPDDEWRAAVLSWMTGDNDSALTCPECGAAAPVTKWDYDAGYGFGNLAFRFWNWPPLRGDFLEELRRELGHPIAVVRGKL